MDVIKIKNLTKIFTIYKDKRYTLKQRVIFRKNNFKEKRLVLDNINLTIKKGEVVILLGNNGCGKSTLLKLISKVLYPTKGNIETKNKILSIIELGAGFHQDFTGRENIYFNGSIYGLSKKEIDKKIKDIIDFSELSDFIDNPIRTYSSGMIIRLAFSIVINIDADIYLFDEILAVGDNHFQKKCLDKINELKAQKKTIIIVSHDLNFVKNIGTRAIWLHDGKIYGDGDVEKIIKEYLEDSDKIEAHSKL